MKPGTLLSVLLLTVLPLSGGTLFTGMIPPSQSTPTNAGTYGPGLTLNIVATGTVNLLGSNSESWTTNPDGSLVTNLSTSCVNCFSAQYSYANPGAQNYPKFNGQGDGINHFPGGGANFDILNPLLFASEGKPTTDTTDPGAIRFGALAYTFASNPSPTDWSAAGSTIFTGNGGTLLFVIVDTYYPNDTGGYSVNVSTALPEPSAVWLALSGVVFLGFTRAVRRRILHR